MYRNSAIVAIAQRKIAASFPTAACTNSAPKSHPIKQHLSLTYRKGEPSKYSEQYLTSFSVFEI